MMLEHPSRIEPARLEAASESVMNIVAEVVAAGSRLGARLHPKTAQNLAGLVRIMNTYYSNLIEGHHTRPQDIERALANDFDSDAGRRDLQWEAASHVRIQSRIDGCAINNELPEPASVEFLQQLHREFYQDAPAALLTLKRGANSFQMEPGVFRHKAIHDNVVGRHQPPSSQVVHQFMAYFEHRFAFDDLGVGTRLLALPAAHHRFNYIHPFPDGNGRVSRLMSHAMAYWCGIGAHGLWSISRGLARGIDSRQEYKQQMDYADTPRQSDLDGRGNLSLKAIEQYTIWFLRVCLDQITFMTSLFDFDDLSRRYGRLVAMSDTLKPQAEALLQEALSRGEFDRGEASRITGLPERTARRVLNEVTREGLLASSTPKGSVSLRFPTHTLEVLFPRLYPEV